MTPPPSTRPTPLRPLLLAFLLVLALDQAPYVVAALLPPAGLEFVGTFHYGDDFYNYLSYAQQAEDGAFLFRNKAASIDHAPALINLEWWLVGLASRALGGGHLLLGYRFFAALATFGFLWVTDRWLCRLGLPSTHRLPALLAVATGGGLGGILFTFTPRALTECLDIYAGLFPFLGLLTNPHFTAGTTLLLLGLLAYESARGLRGLVLATLVASAAALVRPYDFVLIVLVRVLSVFLLEPCRHWLRALGALAGLLPVVGYLYWLFYRHPAFAFYAQTRYTFFPSLPEFLFALGPALLLCGLGVARPMPEEGPRRARVHLLVWVGLGLLVLARPVPFSLQFLVGIGFPLLALGTVGLARWRPAVTAGVALALSTSLLAALRFVSTPREFWFAPRHDFAVVEALRRTCRPTDIFFSPANIGLFAYGLTACRAFVAHSIAPTYERNLEAVQSFGRLAPPERAALLDASGISLLVLPGDAGPRPRAWLGPEARFVRIGLVGAAPRYSLYRREEARP